MKRRAITLKEGVKEPFSVSYDCDSPKPCYRDSFIIGDIPKESLEEKVPIIYGQKDEVYVVEVQLAPDKVLRRESGNSLYDAFYWIRRDLEEEGWMPLCQGARPQAQWTLQVASLGDFEKVSILDAIPLLERDEMPTQTIVSIFEEVSPDLVKSWLVQQGFRQRMPKELFDEYH